ncbi:MULTISPECIES: Gfo/Idh/MocA family protein [Microbacterium]|uniref:Gfo/Idh/MocA family protein n=1 Tax=Microbacterium TaxID=33882 RepID=UPI0022F00A50|nr:Gfo/Idh/MocA family oxidoreductase [Streptomyces sp. MS2A]
MTASAARPPRRRYALCGLSNRGVASFARPLMGVTGEGRDAALGYGTDPDDLSGSAELVAVLDADPARTAAFLDTVVPEGHAAVRGYGPDEVGRMIEETAPDAVIVATPDATHVDYILAALERGVDVLSEKPMTSTAADAARVLAAEQRSRGRVIVTHNLRYSARHLALKRLIAEGGIGRVTYATLEYHVDARHGSSYFLRWNRTRARSGGLSVHKSTHHLDLASWLVDSEPARVFAVGTRNHYGPDGPLRPRAGEEGTDPYSALSPDAATEDGARVGLFGLPYELQYPRGRRFTPFDEEIDIEDTYVATVEFASRAALAYTIDFSSPWEGYRLSVTGTHGRVETVSGRDREGRPLPGSDALRHEPLFGEPRRIAIDAGRGGHDGSDTTMRRHLFGAGLADADRLDVAASSRQAAFAVAAGEAMWRSALSGRAEDVAALLGTEAAA